MQVRSQIAYKLVISSVCRRVRWWGTKYANLAVQRGYDRFTSLVYIDMRELSRPGVSSDQIARWIPNKFGGLKAPDRYRFEVEYRSADGRFVIVRVGPRTDG